jgi:hypothetical protein
MWRPTERQLLHARSGGARAPPSRGCPGCARPWCARVSEPAERQLQEHLPVAYWGDEGESLLLNTFGEVFEANLGDVEADKLPRLSGPQGQSAQLLAMYRQLLPVFEPLDAAIEQLELTDRGSWRASWTAARRWSWGVARHRKSWNGPGAT